MKALGRRLGCLAKKYMKAVAGGVGTLAVLAASKLHVALPAGFKATVALVVPVLIIAFAPANKDCPPE